MSDVKKIGNAQPQGAAVAIQNGGKGSAGVTSKAMKAVGRNMARANNQKGK